MKLAIALIMKGRDIDKIRIFNTNIYSTSDVNIEDVKKDIYKERQDYFNLQLDISGNIEFKNSDAKRYTKIDEGGFILNNKSFIIIGVDNSSIIKGVKYYICYYDGRTDIMSKSGILKLVKDGYTVANANVHGIFIKPCRGNFINIKIDHSKIDECALKGFDTHSSKYLAEVQEIER